MNNTELKAAVTNKPVMKFFKSTDSMRRYLGYRYGYEAAGKIYSEARYERTTIYGNTYEYGHRYWFYTKNGRVGFEQTKADKSYAPREVTQQPAGYDDERDLRRMETMAAYIHTGCGLDNYYADLEAGYID